MLPVEARALVYNVDGVSLIDGIDLTLSTPGITMIMGANGAGKSLLLRILNGLVEPSSGTLHYNGQAVSHTHRQSQAMVFQKPVLLRRSVGANIDFVLKSRNLPVTNRDALLSRVGLEHKVEQPARLLSGGEQQRLALARALAIHPSILFLDEPTASLDPASTQKIESIVTDASQSGAKVIFVSHDVGQAKRLAEDIVFLHRGRLSEHRPAANFFSTPQSDAAQAFIAGRLYV